MACSDWTPSPSSIAPSIVAFAGCGRRDADGDPRARERRVDADAARDGREADRDALGSQPRAPGTGIEELGDRLQAFGRAARRLLHDEALGVAAEAEQGGRAEPARRLAGARVVADGDALAADVAARRVADDGLDGGRQRRARAGKAIDDDAHAARAEHDGGGEEVEARAGVDAQRRRNVDERRRRAAQLAAAGLRVDREERDRGVRQARGPRRRGEHSQAGRHDREPRPAIGVSLLAGPATRTDRTTTGDGSQSAKWAVWDSNPEPRG